MKRVFPFLLATIFVLSGCGSQKEISTSEESNSAETVATTDILASEAADTESSEKEEGTDQTLVGEVVQAYAAFIDEQVQSGEISESAAIGLAHVDADEIPELAVIPMGAHADSVFFYSFDGKEITDLGAYGGFGSCYYERGKGVLYGTYTGQGSTFDMIGIVEKGSLKETCRLECADLSLSSPFDVVGYKYYTREGQNRIEITKEEYKDILIPYLLENREYKVLSYDDAYYEGVLPLIKNTDSIEEALLATLDMEDSYPRADVNELYYGSRINPLDDEKEKFEASALDKLQGVWISAGHSGSTVWVITGKQVKIYNAIFGDAGPTGEYELQETRRVESIEEDVKQWEGDFLVRIGFGDGYYVYREGEDVYIEGEYCEILNNHWDPDGYSGSSSMVKDKSKSRSDFE